MVVEVGDWGYRGFILGGLLDWVFIGFSLVVRLEVLSRIVVWSFEEAVGVGLVRFDRVFRSGFWGVNGFDVGVGVIVGVFIERSRIICRSEGVIRGVLVFFLGILLFLL